VYLDLTHISRKELDRKLGGILEIYEKFQGVDPRETPMKIFPAVHYSMGGLWVDYERTTAGGLRIGSPRTHVTNIPGLYAIGECDYQYHGANRLGANSLLSCIFSGLIVAPALQSLLESNKGPGIEPALLEAARRDHQTRHDQLLKRKTGRENPYLIHQELGDVMTRAATVVRRNSQLESALAKVDELSDRAANCSLSDTGNWTNQNVVFTKALVDMLPVAKAILKGALLRDESRGAHFKPDFSMPDLKATDPAERRQEAEKWCDWFDENTKKWLRSSIATWDGQQPQITYEEVDTTLIPPRPRLYGLAGAQIIDEVYRARQASREANGGSNGSTKSSAAAVAVGS
jgi:succinate dehydrogenase / fumarate reductase flavoprotein subunit